MDVFARIRMEYRPIDSFKEYANNPRLNRAAVPKLVDSIREFGFLVPLVVDSDNTIVCGHTRLEAARQLGMTELPCIPAEALSEDQVRAFRLADNKVAEFSGWDFAKLDLELSALSGALDMEDFGFMLEDLDIPFDPEPDPEPVPTGDAVDDGYAEPRDDYVVDYGDLRDGASPPASGEALVLIMKVPEEDVDILVEELGYRYPDSGVDVFDTRVGDPSARVGRWLGENIGNM